MSSIQTGVFVGGFLFKNFGIVSFNRVLYILNLALEMTTFRMSENVLGYWSWTTDRRVTHELGVWKWYVNPTT